MLFNQIFTDSRFASKKNEIQDKYAEFFTKVFIKWHRTNLPTAILLDFLDCIMPELSSGGSACALIEEDKTKEKIRLNINNYFTQLSREEKKDFVKRVFNDRRLLNKLNECLDFFPIATAAKATGETVLIDIDTSHSFFEFLNAFGEKNQYFNIKLNDRLGDFFKDGKNQTQQKISTGIDDDTESFGSSGSLNPSAEILQDLLLLLDISDILGNNKNALLIIECYFGSFKNTSDKTQFLNQINKSDSFCLALACLSCDVIELESYSFLQKLRHLEKNKGLYVLALQEITRHYACPKGNLGQKLLEQSTSRFFVKKALMKSSASNGVTISPELSDEFDPDEHHDEHSDASALSTRKKSDSAISFFAPSLQSFPNTPQKKPIPSIFGDAFLKII